MPAKQLRFEAPARAALARGAAIVADTVSVTLGPRGRTVVLDKKFGPPLISNDGVTIARELELEDHFENMGAQLLKEVAIKTNDIAGDGTTTATVLARSMLDEGLRNLAAGAAPNDLRRGMMAASDAAVESIRARSHPVKGGDDIRRVATISSGDSALAGGRAIRSSRTAPRSMVSITSSPLRRVPGRGAILVRLGNGVRPSRARRRLPRGCGIKAPDRRFCRRDAG